MKSLRDLGVIGWKWVVGSKALSSAACTPLVLTLSSFPCLLLSVTWDEQADGVDAVCGRLQRKQTGSRSREKFKHFDSCSQNWNAWIWLGGWCPGNEYKVWILAFQINLIGSFDMLAKERCHVTIYLSDFLKHWVLQQENKKAEWRSTRNLPCFWAG